MWRSFSQSSVILFTCLSAYFLIRSVSNLSISDIANLSSTYWNNNLKFAESLCRQRSNTIVGFGLLLLSIIFQMVLLLNPMVDFAMNKVGLILGILCSILVFFIAREISNLLFKKDYNKVEGILKNKQ